MPEFSFILNPAAGKGSGRKVRAPLERLLEKGGSSYEVLLTEGRGHATELARESTARVVVSVGGDGTINEVANGLAGTSKALGIIPTGSGNDLIRSLGIPKKLLRALEIVRHNHIRKLDIGRVACGTLYGDELKFEPFRFFMNGVGVGFDAAVARRVSEMRFLRGTLLYLVSVLQTLGKYRAPVITGSTDEEHWTKRQLLVATGNGMCAGGGFYLTPEAAVDDGLLDVCAIEYLPVRRILPMIPTVMSRKRVEKPYVRYMKTRTLRLESSEGFDVHADGELIGRGVHGVKLDLVPGGIYVITPREMVGGMNANKIKRLYQ